MQLIHAEIVNILKHNKYCHLTDMNKLQNIIDSMLSDTLPSAFLILIFSPSDAAATWYCEPTSSFVTSNK